ncbi:uncharacterized protein N7515_006607 [Penicillium bovifimosum]|uniref:Uncharacterized protein n=1 Tax=Penicillium bovifimosum TaxID=126998 RepID=A0A9W9GVB5_9EURO|nr:uncharacterized protein N7515_006607 [Penicillium bovifimosum]KAJ5130568.1 hypothetical protein N7515_006607 [Penicillium bovifimosum]
MSDPAPTLMSDLPQGYVISFSLRSLRHEARRILEWFKDHTSGSQWIVVLGLSSTMIETLTTERNALHDVPYRFQWEGTTGLIEVVPRGEHEGATSQFSMVIHDELKAMGLPREVVWEVVWVGSKRYRSETTSSVRRRLLIGQREIYCMATTSPYDRISSMTFLPWEDLAGREFLTHCPPDVPPRHRIVALLGTTDLNNASRPGGDGWFVSDCYLFHYLLAQQF